MTRFQQAIAEIQRQFPEKKADSPVEAIVGFLVFVSILALFFWFLESRWPADPDPNNRSRREPGSLKTDISYLVLGSLIDKLLAIPAFVIIVIFVALHIPRLDTIVSRQPIPLQFLEAAFLADLCMYWIHRFQHTNKSLWRFHAVHHSSTHLDWIAGARGHPFEGVIARTLAIVPLFLAGFSPSVYAAMGPILGLYGVMLHANVDWDFGRFRWILGSPRYHRWHHSSEPEALDKNFAALFPVIDRLFGTAYLPADRKPVQFGLANDWMPRGIWRQLRHPFRRRATPPPLPAGQSL